MRNAEFSDEDFLRALASSGARVLLIGRRALVLLGAPVVTADYDVWVHIDDIEKLNFALKALEHVPTKSPAEARATGRYVLEDGERVDVLVARDASSPDGTKLAFDDAWTRRQKVTPLSGVDVFLPSLDDLITTKLWGSRPKDLIDIQYLHALKKGSA